MMRSRVNLHPAWVLHTRAYSESSLLVEVITMDYGRISGIARGVQRPHSALRGLLRPFVPLLISWSGKTELVSFSKVEALGAPHRLAGRLLLHGFYLNELIMRLLHRYDPHPHLYTAYQQALLSLQQGEPAELVVCL